ncbi:hypothetical protein BH11MYX1_BH11MYX1_40390 [soil metagenome]
MDQDLETRARGVDALIARARALPTVQRIRARQAKTVAENERRWAAGALEFIDTPGRLSPLVPMIIDHAQGCRIHDLDGNSFIDLHLGFWTGILGHSPEVVVEAVRREIGRGTNVGVGHDLEIELCELLVEHIACADIACLAVSGTSALMHALKLARASTGKRKVAKFGNAFHGHDNDLLSDLPEFKLGLPGSDSTLVLPPGPEAFELVRAHASTLAAIVVEPAPPLRDPRPFYDLAFYRELRALTSELGIVLVFDEVLRGFRSRFGATLDAEGIVPDLACFGKIIGGGMGVAAVVGKRAIMQSGRTTGNPMRDGIDRVPLMGTYAGNRIACAAGLAQLHYIRDHQAEIYPYMRDKSQWLGAQINAHAAKHHVPLTTAVFDGGLVMIKPVHPPGPSPMHPVVLLQAYLRDSGCYFMGGPIQISPAHTSSDVEEISGAFEQAMANIVRDTRDTQET